MFLVARSDLAFLAIDEDGSEKFRHYVSANYARLAKRFNTLLEAETEMELEEERWPSMEFCVVWFKPNPHKRTASTELREPPAMEPASYDQMGS